MDLKDLKNTWDKMSSAKELDENQLRKMLGKRTSTLIERIERNIRIGFIILIAIILLFVLNDFVFSPQLAKELDADMNLPGWLQVFSVFGDLLIVFTFLFFVIRYYKVKKTCTEACDLKHTLLKTIATLKLYKTLFYISIFIILISITTNFLAGIYQGVLIQAQGEGLQAHEIGLGTLATTVYITVLIMFLFTFFIFHIFRWGFRRLYGNYIQKLKLTLKELEEIEV